MSDAAGRGRRVTAPGDRFLDLSPEDRARALAEAADYRGDVTLHLEGGRRLEGYVFANEPSARPPHVRLFPKDRDEKVVVAHHEIVGLEFSGEDKAFGRSWEAWSERHAQARRAIERGEDPGEYEPRPDLPEG